MRRGGFAMSTEFVIISAPHVHDFLLEVRSQLRSYLEASFPEFSFSLATSGGEGLDFVVVPIAHEGPLGLAQEQVLNDIRITLEAFQPRTAH